jgi:PAS domain S-box-containing protein
MKSPLEIFLSFFHSTGPLTPRGIGGPRIRAREAFAYIVVFTLALVTVGVFVSWHIASLRQREISNWRARQSSIADDRAHSVSAWLTARQADAHVFAALPSVRAVLRAHYEGGQFPKYPSAGLSDSLAVLDEMATSYSYAGVYILDRDAHVVVQSSRSIPLDPLFAETCRAVAHSGVMRIDLVDDLPHRTLIGFSAPVFPAPGTTDAGRPPGQMLGIVLVVSDASQTLFPLVTREVVPTRTGETLLVRREGNDIVFFSPLRNVPPGSPNLRFLLSAAPTPARLALTGRETFAEYNDYRGVPSLAATQHIPVTGWGMVREIDRAEALEDFRRMAIAEWLAAGLLVILLGGMLLFFRRYVVTRVRKQEEEQFRALLESAPDAMVVVNKGAEIVLLNLQAEKQFGYCRDELVGKNVKSIIPVGFAERLVADALRSVEEALAQQIGTGIELMGRRKDGSDFPIEIMLSPLKSTEGILVTAAIRDISTRKDAEEHLVQMESRYRGLLEAAPDAMVVVNQGGEIVLLNVQAEKQFGYRRDELVGKHVKSIIPEGFAERLVADALRPVEEALAQQIGTGIELMGRRKDGSDFPIEIMLSPLKSTEGILVTTAIRDISTRKRAEEALRESEEKYRSLVWHIPDVAWTLDAELRFVFISKNITAISGISADEVEEQGLDFYLASLHPDDVHKVKDGLRALFAEGRAYDVECRVKHKDGKWVWVHDRALATYEINGSRYTDGLLSDITERKQAQEEVNQSRQMLKSVLDTIPERVFWKDRNIVYLGCNQAFALDAGLKDPAEIIGKTDYELVWKETAESYRVDDKLVMEQEAPRLKYEEIQNRPDGSLIWLRTSKLPLRDREGKVIGMIGTYEDITERKRAETELRLTQFSVEHAADGIFWMDPQGRITRVNEAACRSLGRSRGELLSLSIPDIDPLFPKEAWGAFWEKLKSSGSETFETQHQTKQGRVFPVAVTANRLEFDGKEYSLAFVRDITERKRAEAERMRLMTGIEQAAEAVVITDAKGDIQYVNPAFSAMTGYSREEALGKNPRILKSGKQDAALYAGMWATILAGQPWRGEMINCRKDGKLYTEMMSITPVLNEHKELTHFVAIKEDITARKLLEDQFRQAQKMEAVGRLAAGVAHDFNNLLTIILGYSDLLLGGFVSGDPMRAYTTEIKGAGERAVGLTRQLLAFSRQQVLAAQVLDLNNLVANLTKMLKRLIGEDIDLVFNAGPSPPTVKADPGQIEQVLMNLAVNSRDAMPRGGKLTIETSHVQVDEAYSSTHFSIPAGPYAVLVVSDTGCGMDKDTQAHIFEPFFTTKEQGKGTGLGLATVYGIVKQSGGYIWVYSEPGTGTTFKIHLPAFKGPLQAAQESAVPAGGSETVLLVEDDAGLRELARMVLVARGGYKVLESIGGKEARLFAEQYKGTIHLLLTDVVMPGMGGRELSEKLATLRPEMKILYMSGYTDDTVLRHGVLEEGMAFLQKPFTAESLLRKVRDVLDTRPQA